MRKPLILSMLPPLLICLAALLWLLWCFIPLSVAIKGLLSLLLVAAASRIMWVARPRDIPSSQASPVITSLPDSLSGPLVLVCGDGLEQLFPTQPVRHTAQGCWLRVDNVSELQNVVRMLQAHQPALVGQLAVMYCCLADKHQDEAVLRAGLKTVRQAIRQVTLLTGFPLFQLPAEVYVCRAAWAGIHWTHCRE